MSATDVTQLRQRLEELLAKLELFDKNLEGDFRSLDVAWAQLQSVWGGVAYQTFEEGWSNVRNAVIQYTDMSERYEHFLRERIDALQKFERSGGM